MIIMKGPDWSGPFSFTEYNALPNTADGMPRDGRLQA